MTRGTKPMPRNMRLIKGGRTDRLNRDEPIVEVSIPDAPETLSDEAREIWYDIAPKLARMRVMTEADTHALEMYCESYVEWREATDRVREGGMVVRSPNGHPIQNPYLSIKNKAQERCLKILAEFGLTPSSRTRVTKA